ncbi:MAG: ABC transporter ATP-binding protein [Myxococcales bacterium]|nr:ABC transporter ATP-binding protein [Myxococcales bacterium]
MIQVQGLTKFYGQRCAVRDVSFALERGQVIGLLGLNGSGKTTILRMLAGDLEPSAGLVRVLEHDLVDAPKAYRRQVGFLPDRVPLYPDLSVREYLDYLARLRGSIGGTRVLEVCEQVDLATYIDEPIVNLSHGYRKRLGIASAIIHRPALVILDEPISGLDPIQIVEMRKLIRTLAQDHSVLLSSHFLSEISQTCDQLLVLKEGEIVAQESETSLQSRLSNEVAYDLTVHGEEGQIRNALEALGDLHIETASGSTFDLRLRSATEAQILAKTVIDAGLGLSRLHVATGGLESLFMAIAQNPETEAATPEDVETEAEA